METPARCCVFLLHKTIKNIHLINDWYSLAVKNNYHYIDDSPSELSNHVSFIENRHDQAIFSILRKLHGTLVLQNEVDISYHSPQMHLPIWGTRIRN
jgi:hypothetical protein